MTKTAKKPAPAKPANVGRGTGLNPTHTIVIKDCRVCNGQYTGASCNHPTRRR